MFLALTRHDDAYGPLSCPRMACLRGSLSVQCTEVHRLRQDCATWFRIEGGSKRATNNKWVGGGGLACEVLADEGLRIALQAPHGHARAQLGHSLDGLWR